MGHVNPVDVIANAATGGLYGVGQGIAEGRPLQAAASAGPFGAISQPTLGTGPTLGLEAVGTGAGLGGGGLGAGGFGTAGTEGAGAITGGLGAMGAGLGAGAAQTGMGLVNSLTAMTQPMPGMTGPSTPAAFPVGGALPGGATPQQLSAVASEKHPGLAPWFGLRVQGQQPPGGIAEPNANALAMMQQNPNLWMRG